MAAKLKESIIHWKKKLERIPDEDVILSVIHKLSKIPITLELLQETHIGKCIRNLSKRDDIVGEKSLAVLNKWRITFASASDSTSKKHKSISRKENVNRESCSKSSNKSDTSYEISVKHHQKESLNQESKINTHQKSSSDNSQSSNKYMNSNCNGNSSDESSPYIYERKEASSKYISYDPHSDISEGYNPECPDLFPSSTSTKKKLVSNSVDTYEPSQKRKHKEEAETMYESKPKKLKSESKSDHISEKKQEKLKKHASHEDKHKSHSEKVHSLNVKKEKGDKVKSENDLKKKSMNLLDSKKSKSRESDKSKEKNSKSKAKLKINCTEEFTSSEVRFEDCLGFNDIVIKKKKNLKPTQSTPKKVMTVNNKPSSSHSSNPAVPKKNSIQKEKLHVDVPKPKELGKIEVDIMSTLPPTMPNYKPLPRVECPYPKKREVLSNEDAILFMSSKREKTAVYSGRKSYYTGEVPSLFDICTKILQENLDAIENVGGLPYFVMKQVLEKCSPTQLYSIENHNPYLLDDTHDLWEIHCKRDYKLHKLEENETYRELYLRAHEERERKLKNITANISASMSKSCPIRQVKLAYVDSVAKPPRDVARKQAKHGTAQPVNHPVKAGPSSKATPRPLAPVVNTTASHISASSNYVPKKPKVAPLMAKTLKSMKQCFRRK